MSAPEIPDSAPVAVKFTREGEPELDPHGNVKAVALVNGQAVPVTIPMPDTEPERGERLEALRQVFKDQGLHPQ